MEGVSEFDFVVNLRQLGVTAPRSVLARATEILE
jgi:hypothetical protein